MSVVTRTSVASPPTQSRSPNWSTAAHRMVGHLLRAGRREWRAARQRANLAAVLNQLTPYTMVPETTLVQLAMQVDGVLAANVPGALVECGVWRGGAAFLMA